MSRHRTQTSVAADAGFAVTAPLVWPLVASTLHAVEAAQDADALTGSVRPFLQTVGATLLGFVEASSRLSAAGVRLRAPLSPDGLVDAFARLPARRGGGLLYMTTGRTAPFRLRAIAETEALAGQIRYARVFATHGLHDGLCIPRWGIGGERELAILAGPALELDDATAFGAARIVVETFADRLQRMKPARPEGCELLTQRQRDCLDAALRGANSIQIAAQLRLAPKTVDAYIAAAATRLGAVNRTAAVAAAVQLGLIG